MANGFHIEQGCIGNDDQNQEWKRSPGFVAGLERRLFCVCYWIGDTLWAIGIAFHSRADAETAIKYLDSIGMNSRDFHALEKVGPTKRAILENLRW